MRNPFTKSFLQAILNRPLTVRDLVQLFGLWLLLTLLSSCAPVEYALSSTTNQVATEAAAPTGLEPVVAQLQPAPADMTRAEAKRYYAAQVALAKASTVQKVKNSGNTTVEQKISNVSPGAIRTIIALSFLVGAFAGGLVVFKFGRLA
jgi:uncharacterized iron-regulated membrane protein